MSKKYGYFYEEELDKWEHLPATTLVLTSNYMGAWLLRRDERKGNRERIEELEKIKAEIGEIEETDHDFEGFYYCQNEVLKIIEKSISELKGETNDIPR